jgi:hypothetical protein
MALYATNLAIKLTEPNTKPSKQTHLFIADLIERDPVKKLILVCVVIVIVFEKSVIIFNSRPDH